MIMQTLGLLPARRGSPAVGGGRPGGCNVALVVCCSWVVGCGLLVVCLSVQFGLRAV